MKLYAFVRTEDWYSGAILILAKDVEEAREIWYGLRRNERVHDDPFEIQEIALDTPGVIYDDQYR